MPCIVVPFRAQVGIDRAAHPEAFLQRGVPRIADAGVQPVVVVVATQADARPFNRGTLLNAGILWATEHAGADQVWMHDVDLIPSPAVARLYHQTIPAGTAVHLGSCWGR